MIYEFLSSWMRTLSPPDLSFAINDLCKRYSVDLAGLSRGASMDWDDLTTLAADPNVTIGSATVNYPVLSNLKDADAQREMAMGKAVAEAAFHRTIKHFAYPFGDRDAFRRAHVAMAQEMGLASAATVLPGVVDFEGIYQSACVAARRLGRTAAFAAHDARDAVGGVSSEGKGETDQSGVSAKFRRRAATSS